jgi:hypothetical protein
MGVMPIALMTLAALVAPIPARADDPVVFTGADIRPLIGQAPGRIAAFSRAGGRWREVRVQVDERALVDLNAVYGGTPSFGSARVLTWTDPATFTGPDPDPKLDADDEVALMGGDLGERAGGARPPRAGRRVEIAVRDPLSRRTGYVTLVATKPKRFRPLVAYSFRLVSGDYKATYKRSSGPNPERSTIATRTYRRGFSDRWTDDVARVGRGPDVLDRHTAMFPATCARSEDTFNAGEGAFVANRVGPVRAIRSYIGANSGPFTQRDHVFYADREQIVTHLRVHAIPGIMDLLDYSPAAVGMTYRSSIAPAGVRIDGRQDTVAAGPVRWEQATGRQGTLTSVHSFDTDIPGFSYTSRYSDSAAQQGLDHGTCTGDGKSYGVSGPVIDKTIPATDPRTPGARRLDWTRTLLYGAPRATAADARALARRVDQPLRPR